MDNHEVNEIKELILFTSMSCIGITSLWNMANYFDNMNNKINPIYNYSIGIKNIQITTKIFFDMAMFATIGTTMGLMFKIWYLK